MKNVPNICTKSSDACRKEVVSTPSSVIDTSAKDFPGDVRQSSTRAKGDGSVPWQFGNTGP